VLVCSFFNNFIFNELAGKVEVFGTTGSGGVVTGETFKTTHDVYDTVGKERAMTDPSGLTAAFSGWRTAKRSRETAWGFNPRWGGRLRSHPP
jgi:hypothetical protein